MLTPVERFRLMLLIRRFEECVYRLYQRPGLIGGFCHLYSGQEAIAVGIACHFRAGEDRLAGHFRAHGHALSLGMPPWSLMAELCGRVGGCCRGKGGSAHLFDAAHGNLGGFHATGSQMPLGIGAAFAMQYQRVTGVCFVVFSDGAVNTGYHNETLNLAGLLKLPAVFVLENNGVAMGTVLARHSAEKDLTRRAMGFGMPVERVDGNDVDAVADVVGRAVEWARGGEGPSYIVADTYRQRGYSMSDPQKYRKLADGHWTQEHIEALRRDPIELYREKLLVGGLLDRRGYDDMEGEVEAILVEAAKFAESSPQPELDERFADVYAERYPFDGRSAPG
jgi:pyruvate dehydrogenase E1 component alpha subunit